MDNEPSSPHRDEAPKDATIRREPPPLGPTTKPLDLPALLPPGLQRLTLPDWVTILAGIIFIAGVVGSMVLAVDLSEYTSCDDVDLGFTSVAHCETKHDAGTLVGVAMAGILQTIVAFVLLLAVAEALRHFRAIAAAVTGDSSEVSDTGTST